MVDRLNGTNPERRTDLVFSLNSREQEFLRSQDLILIQLEPKPFRQLLEEGLRINHDWSDYPKVMDSQSSGAVVAYNPRNFYLSEDGGLPDDEQDKRLREFDREVVKRGMPSLKAQVMNLAEYAQIGRDYFERTGKNIFLSGQLEFAVTTTKIGSMNVNVGMERSGAIDLYQWGPRPSNFRIGVAPIIVHDKSYIMQR